MHKIRKAMRRHHREGANRTRIWKRKDAKKFEVNYDIAMIYLYLFRIVWERWEEFRMDQEVEIQRELKRPWMNIYIKYYSRLCNWSEYLLFRAILSSLKIKQNQSSMQLFLRQVHSFIHHHNLFLSSVSSRSRRQAYSSKSSRWDTTKPIYVEFFNVCE